VAEEHPSSLLGDDALFEAAALAQRSGNAGEACRVAEELVKTRPDSRYSRCASELCARLSPDAECRPYVRRRIQAALRGAADVHSSSSSR
jgi:hypothetical protein